MNTPVQSSNDAFWLKAARRFSEACAALHLACGGEVPPGEDSTLRIEEVRRLATDDGALSQRLLVLNDEIRGLDTQGRNDLADEYRALHIYFSDEWARLDPKTKMIIVLALEQNAPA